MRVIVRFSTWPAGSRGVTMSYRKHVRWTDLPIGRRRRLVVILGELILGHVGLVLGIEVSRLARSCRDWHQLLEMCALFDTLIGDADGIYDPGTYNDRLLLGLKGTMSEAELHILKSRMHEGRRAKARRGELIMGLPRGYVLKPSGDVALDPDEGVQQAIRQVFAVFERRRSIMVYLCALAV
ncbi:recombinase family protein [Sphingobium sp. YR768]|uniref:recombinase family protein n=1 Tax=Sphingobium sp. YR768 TaxID=1884365 RepID=UPI0021098D09|nr:recombinase family protein [Sphingobium sp. YR768]